MIEWTDCMSFLPYSAVANRIVLLYVIGSVSICLTFTPVDCVEVAIHNTVYVKVFSARNLSVA